MLGQLALIGFVQDYKELFAEEETGTVKAERRSTEDDSSTYTGQPTLNIQYRKFSKKLYTKAPMAACCSLICATGKTVGGC